MTKEELKKKICDIISPWVSAWGDDERIADALIEAGIGDVERQHDVFKKAYMDFFTKLYLDKKFHKNFDSITLGCQIGKFEDMIARAEKELAEEAHATAMAVLQATKAETTATTIVEITETYQKRIRVTHGINVTKEKVLQYIQNQYYESNIVLDTNNYVDTEFDIIEMDETAVEEDPEYLPPIR